ncbi:Voltage-gated ClC-type chloride channel ClcB [Methylobacterium crusticola]|uniref:Voltage-gated ClC-type chloride channel ClcB n=1 Tax=Methylobacterium crusticola TaxID=1697972 RepID=A0ABQ4QTL0_9HYPH|nr:chloride channel protein [Methylobacterium crusticola]GJD48661.1 Voltage-gated ClC-type chloride channel ClcB [Methylobacterium crusticola]
MRSPQPNLDDGDVGWIFWGLALATGGAAGLAAGLLMQWLRLVQALAWGEGAAGFAAAVEAASPHRRLAVLAGAGLLVSLGGLALRRASRAGGGHGAELSAAIWFHGGRLPFVRTLAQGVLSVAVVGLGASLGREAAPKQAGAAFGSLFARRLRLSRSHARILAAFGAGAGIAAVYEVPLGGALFALEVLLGSLALPLVAPALLASGLATAVAWLLLPDRAIYTVPGEAVTASLFGFAVLAGPLAGVAAAAYVRLIASADAHRPSGLSAALAPVLVLALLGAAATLLPQVLGNGKDVAERAFTGGIAWPLLALLVVGKPLATAACLGCGAPGGLFTPTVAFGAVFGGLLAVGWDLVWPGAGAGPCALVAATALLAAATQGPVSSVVLMLELTRRLDSLMVPVLVAVAGAMLVARVLEPRSLYACRIREGRAAADADPAALSAAAPYAEVLRALPAGGPGPRVLDETGACLGTLDPARVRAPARADGPLVAATAGDFLDAEERRG